MPNLDVLKQVKILYRFDAPAKKEFRKITEEDKAIFDSLGIAYSWKFFNDCKWFCLLSTNEFIP